jgi:hypothetical protein
MKSEISPGEIYPGIDPSRLARIGRTIITTEYVRAVYGEDVAERYDRARRELGSTSAPELNGKIRKTETTNG